MAKVWGPCHSDDARNKLGNAIVFSGWKGIQTVRRWLIPRNPKGIGQGNIRTIIGAVGRAVGKVLLGEVYDVKIKETGFIPQKQSKQSYLVKFIKDNYFNSAGATLKSNYATTLKEFTGHVSEAVFNTSAAGIGIPDFGMVYDDIATFPKGLGLYLLAKAGIALTFTGSPYTKTLAAWTATQIGKLVVDLQGT